MKKGFVSVSVLMILTVLNMIFISLATQSLKYKFTNVNSIRDSERVAYYNSCFDLNEEVIKKIFREVLIKYIETESENSNFLNFAYTEVNFKLNKKKIYSSCGLSDYKPNDISCYIGKDNRVYLNIYYIKKDYINYYSMTYRLKNIKFDAEDKRDMKEKNIDKIVEKYSDRLIDDKKRRIS